MPNLFVIYALFIGLFANKPMGVTYGILAGMILDLTIGKKIGINTISLGIIGFISAVFDKNFSKDNNVYGIRNNNNIWNNKLIIKLHTNRIQFRNNKLCKNISNRNSI